MTDLRPTPMDRAPQDPTAPLLGPGQWHREAPVFRKGEEPAHVALIMDGNGRWANSRGLARTEGHRAGEYALMDTIAGAIDAGVRYLSVYTFSTENWKRSPAEVSFIMNYASDVLARRTDQLAQWGVHVRWSGRRPKLWKSVINALEKADRATSHCKTLDLIMCQLRRSCRAGGRRQIHRRGRRGRAPEPARRHRKDTVAPPLPARRSRRRPHDPHVGRTAPLQLSAVADGVRRNDVRRHALAGLRP